MQEQHRDLDPVEVLVADALGFAWRVQRIAQEDQSGRRHAVGHAHRGDPAAERLAAGEHGLPIGTGDAGAERAEPRLAEDPLGVGRATPPLDVREVESHRRDTVLRDGPAEPGHERMIHTGPRPVAEHERGERVGRRDPRGRYGPGWEIELGADLGRRHA